MSTPAPETEAAAIEPVDDRPLAVRRMEEAEDLMASGMSPSAVAKHMAKKHGVGRIYAATWAQGARERWRDEAPAAEAEREAKRKHLHEAAWTGVHLAYTRKSMVLDKHGGEHYFAAPDVGAAKNMLEFLGHLDGLLELTPAPIHVNLTLEQRINAVTVSLQQHYFGNVVEPVALPEATSEQETSDGKR